MVEIDADDDDIIIEAELVKTSSVDGKGTPGMIKK